MLNLDVKHSCYHISVDVVMLSNGVILVVLLTVICTTCRVVFIVQMVDLYMFVHSWKGGDCFVCLQVSL